MPRTRPCRRRRGMRAPTLTAPAPRPATRPARSGGVQPDQAGQCAAGDPGRPRHRHLDRQLCGSPACGGAAGAGASGRHPRAVRLRSLPALGTQPLAGPGPGPRIGGPWLGAWRPRAPPTLWGLAAAAAGPADHSRPQPQVLACNILLLLLRTDRVTYTNEVLDNAAPPSSTLASLPRLRAPGAGGLAPRRPGSAACTTGMRCFRRCSACLSGPSSLLPPAQLFFVLATLVVPALLFADPPRLFPALLEPPQPCYISFATCVLPNSTSLLQSNMLCPGPEVWHRAEGSTLSRPVAWEPSNACPWRCLLAFLALKDA